MTTKICAIHFDGAGNIESLDLGSHRFAKFVREDESRFVLAIQIASELKSRNAFRAIDDDDDSRQKIGERHLAAGEDRPGRDRELMTANTALMFAALDDIVGVERTALRANRCAIRLWPTHLFEEAPSRFLSGAIDLAERNAPGLCCEKEVGCHGLDRSTKMVDLSCNSLLWVMSTKIVDESQNNRNVMA